MTKVCNTCKIEKELKMFHKHKRTLGGYRNKCKECIKIESKIYFEKNRAMLLEKSKKFLKTIDGIIAKSFGHQLETCRDKKLEKPEWNLQELREFLKNNEKFVSLYNCWVSSNYLSELRPTIDRVDSSKGYTWKNIQIMTWEDNDKKGCEYQFKKTYVYDKNFIFLGEYESAAEAAKETNSHISRVVAVANGRRKSTNNLIFTYDVSKYKSSILKKIIGR